MLPEHTPPSFWERSLQRRLAQRGGAVPLGADYYSTIKELGHCFVLGGSQTGKTRWMEFLMLMVWTLHQRITTIYVDPHGFSSLELLKHFFRIGREQDVILIDLCPPKNLGLRLEYNPFRVRGGEDVGERVSMKVSALTAAQGLTGVESIRDMPILRENYTAFFGALMELSLSLSEGLVLLDPANNGTRTRLIRQLTNPFLRQFWQHINTLKPKEREKRLDLIRARLTPFWANTLLCDMTSNPMAQLDMAHIIESGKTVIIRAGAYRGLSPEDVRVITSLMVEEVIAACFAREQDTGCWTLLVADELRTGIIASEAVSKLLAEAMKFRLSTILATQSFSNLTREQPGLAGEVKANAMTKIIHRDASVEDLEALGKDFVLESLDFEKVKEEIFQTKFWPVETKRTIHSHSHSEGEGSGHGYSDSVTVGQTIMPDPNGGFLTQPTVISHNNSGGGSSSSSSSFSSDTDSYTVVPWYEYVPFQELSSKTFYTPEELQLKLFQLMKSLPARMFCLKRRGERMMILKAPHWPDYHMPRVLLDEKVATLLQKSNLYATIEQIEQQANTRLNQLTNKPHHGLPAQTQHKTTPLSPTELERVYDKNKPDS